MKYLCLIYYEEQKLNALSTRDEWDALIGEASAYDEAKLATTSCTSVGNDADRIQRHEPLAAHTT
jgi:hypothetical protein